VTAEEWVRLLASLNPPNLRKQLEGIGDAEELLEELNAILANISEPEDD